jgi:isoquinoline 1-oxidoreductase beta subunit
MSAPAIGRREFIKLTIGASGGLLIGLYLPTLDAKEEAAAPAEFAPNAFVRIAPDESITVIVNHSEMGQGVYTTLPMLLADELDADWKNVRFEPAPVDPVYNSPAFGMQATGGSTSTWSSFDPMRQAGAAARAMLISAAAEQWKVEAAQCRVEEGIVHGPSPEMKISYGQLAERAALLKPPAEIVLKDPKNFYLIGKPLKRLDTPEKTNGKAIFGIDARLPGMMVALVARAPVFGARLKTWNSKKAEAIKGVRKVVEVPSGVAVLANGFWAAHEGRDALEIEWDEGAMANFSSRSQREEYASLAKQPGLVARKDGDAAAAMAGASKKVEAIYEVPYLSHAMMEPLNCTVDLRADSCEIWTGTQFQTGDRAAAAQIAALKPESVQLHTTFLGGGFGRRGNPHADFVSEAVHVAKAAGAPAKVKVIWTREDDMHGGYYRPAYLHAIEGSVDTGGMPHAWSHRIVGQSIAAGTPFEGAMVKNGIDETSVEGAADIPYAIPNIQVEYHLATVGVPVLWWRSVGHSHNAFVVESFLDELAASGGKDPYELRRQLLAKHPRELGVLNLAAEKAGWGKPLPKGRGRGIAMHSSFGSYVAEVVEASVEEGNVRIHRVVCAVDCGVFVNPGIIEAEMQGGIIFGLTAALYGELTFEKGRVQQSNFNNYQMLRMAECPEIEVHIVHNQEKMGGIGEPGVPPAAPALVNAIFQATGKRIRKLPIRMSEAV